MNSDPGKAAGGAENGASGSALCCEAQVEVKNADGLHMRPAMQFVDAASTFGCDIKVSNGQLNVDGKSIMQISMLAATRGTKLTIIATGPRADEAVSVLKALLEESPPVNSAGGARRGR